jgi:hypothetical protein
MNNRMIKPALLMIILILTLSACSKVNNPPPILPTLSQNPSAPPTSTITSVRLTSTHTPTESPTQTVKLFTTPTCPSNNNITQTVTLVPKVTQIPALRYDGIYQLVESYYCIYLRFYKDGTVLSAGSISKPEEVVTWLNKSYQNSPMEKYISEGQYVLWGTILKFTVSNKQGKVYYYGTINGDELIFDVYSYINNYRGKEVYHFVDIIGIQP